MPNDVISKIDTGERPPAEDSPRLDAVPELDTTGALARLWEHLKKARSSACTAGSRSGPASKPRPRSCAGTSRSPPRLARQAILDRTGAPQLWCILDEGVLHRAIGGAKVMRNQLYRLAEVAEHPRTTIQVIRSGGAHAGLLAHFVIADLDSKPSVVYLETAAEGIVTDSSSAVNHVALRFDRLWAQAESWAASRDLIKKVSEERWT